MRSLVEDCISWDDICKNALIHASTSGIQTSPLSQDEQTILTQMSLILSALRVILFLFLFLFLLFFLFFFFKSFFFLPPFLIFFFLERWNYSKRKCIIDLFETIVYSTTTSDSISSIGCFSVIHEKSRSKFFCN